MIVRYGYGAQMEKDLCLKFRHYCFYYNFLNVKD